MNEDYLDKSILKTVCYFDLFDYPPTILEIWRWFFNLDLDQTNSPGLSQIRARLTESNLLRQEVGYRDGFYFLAGKEHLVFERMNRHNIAVRKFRKALKIIRLLKFLPYIKMIAVSNTLAYSNSRTQGDIDLFFITEHDKLWQARFLVVTFLKFLGLRPTAEKNEDRFCTPFFVSERHLNLEMVKSSQHDSHFACWLSQIWPVWNEKVYQELFEKNNWIKKIVPNALMIKTSSRRSLIGTRSWTAEVLAAILDFVPRKLFCWLQLRVMPASLKGAVNKNNDVVINDHLLKFHQQDKRAYYNKRLSESLDRLLCRS